MSENKKKLNIFRLIDRIEGDKVIWIIVLMLIMISIVTISSSTPLLALMNKSTRGAIINEQVLVSVAGLAIILFFYHFVKKIGVIRFVSKLGFLLSFILLAMLAIRINTPIVRALRVNNAVRALSIFGFQLHVFEFTKVLMIMYLAWAVQAYKEGKMRLADRMVGWGMNFMKKDIYRLILYIFLPMVTVCLLTLLGGVSSTLFVALVMTITILIGGIKFKYIMGLAAVGAGLFIGCIGIYKISGGSVFGRIGTAVERISLAREDPEEELVRLVREGKKNTQEFKMAEARVKQPISAKVAVSEGGIIGKGPGGSTQRYVVPIMFEDYMFSFIVEEYGIIGALIIIMLYGSLLARGVILVRNASNAFTKTAIAGLVVMISGQALMHMFINVDLGPLTGQTLPMISHGKASFLAFSMAFGIILAVSRMVKKNMDKEVEGATPLISSGDSVQDSMNDLDQLEKM
ncbi:MAG: FtsW/RodA/SpoVE family cell cycle protein [Bacteroidales bacterium]|nr:FtsW/RodA/SpoVE family cell cycle protein [Bacteroidales bacterium]MBQ9186172.1 FtsW/RodA/SpoVE family cell cycle protein [Bacteroidales bacterium]